MKFRVVALAALVLVSVASCVPGPPQLLAKQKLFTLRLGTLDDQIDLFQRANGAAPQRNRFQFSNGLVVVSDGNARKVMEFSSYGDLLSLYYNSDDSPVPSLYDSSTGPDAVAQVKNRRAFAYPFNQIGEIALTPQNQLYVEDTIPVERRSFDPDLVAVLQSRILRFDRDGNFLDFLGQEGVGGTPFPLINSLTETAKGDLVVICRGGQGWEIWWYDPAGTLVSKIFLKHDKLPFPSGVSPDSPEPQLEALFPDWNERMLHIKIDYYREIEDPTTRTALDVQVAQTRVWTFDAMKQVFTSSYQIPILKRHKGPGDAAEPTGDRPFTFVGVSGSGLGYFLSSPEAGSQRFLVLHPDGSTALERNIAVDGSDTLFGQYRVTHDGILVGFLSDGNQAEIDWWRSDQLLGAYAASGF